MIPQHLILRHCCHLSLPKVCEGRREGERREREERGERGERERGKEGKRKRKVRNEKRGGRRW